MFTINYEADSGILRSEVFGCWDVPTVRRYAVTIATQARQAAENAGRLKLLAHVAERTFADDEAAAQLRHVVKEVAAASPDSRVALLVKSSFMKTKTGVTLDRGVQAFMSEHAARTWLTAYDV